MQLEALVVIHISKPDYDKTSLPLAQGALTGASNLKCEGLFALASVMLVESLTGLYLPSLSML